MKFQPVIVLGLFCFDIIIIKLDTTFLKLLKKILNINSDTSDFFISRL